MVVGAAAAGTRTNTHAQATHTNTTHINNAHKQHKTNPTQPNPNKTNNKQQTTNNPNPTQNSSNFKANPDYKGVCHVALAQEGHCKPGEVLFGTDSHTCNAGAFGQFATGVGNTDAGFILGTGKLLIKVPPTMRFVMDGQMPEYLLAKDLILQIIGEITVAGATYKAMEFAGSAIESMNMDERMTICNMVVEAGGKNGVIAPDQTTFDYVKARTADPFEPVYTDAGAKFIEEYRWDVSKLEPVVAAPHSPDNRKLARECRDVKIDRVYIGSCTGARMAVAMGVAMGMRRRRR